MTARDELAADLFMVYEHAHIWQAEPRADQLHAAGWRKMPTKDEVVALFAGDGALHILAPRIADAVLALMDGDNE